MWQSIAYVTGTLRSAGRYTADRTHEVTGPFVAYLVVVGILLTAHYVQHVHDAARGLVVVMVVVMVVGLVVGLAVVAAQLLAHWSLGSLRIATVHPGYFLPTVAGSFIASIGLSSSGWHDAAASAFGVGVFLWLVIGTLVFDRLFLGDPLPVPSRPTLSALVSPPGTAGIAWFLLAGGRFDEVGYLLLGILFMLLPVQVVLLPGYLDLAIPTSSPVTDTTTAMTTTTATMAMAMAMATKK